MIPDTHTELRLNNARRDRAEIILFPDTDCQKDFVGFKIAYGGKDLTLCDKPISGDEEEFFHLEKFQVGCLIDYLKRIYDSMEDVI